MDKYKIFMQFILVSDFHVKVKTAKLCELLVESQACTKYKKINKCHIKDDGKKYAEAAAQAAALSVW